MTEASLRDQAREVLRVYTARTGISLGELALRMGYARQSLVQFSSHQEYGSSDGSELAKRLMEFIALNPPEIPVKVSGRLYPTANTRIIDELLAEVKAGAWGLLYGPPGTQKTETFKHRMLESYGAGLDPDVVWVQCEEGMAPNALLQEIAVGVGAYIKNGRHSQLQALRYTVGRRARPLALVIDEAQKLMRRVDTIETLRDVGDKCEVGLLIAGHDDVEKLFEPRPNNQFAQWRSRVEQLRRHLAGLSAEEAGAIVTGELGPVPALSIDIMLKGTREHDAKKGCDYISARRLFFAINKAKRRLRGGKTN